MAIYHTPGKKKGYQTANRPDLERLIEEMEKMYPGFEIVHAPAHKQKYRVYSQGGLIASGDTLPKALAAALAG